MSEFKTEGVIVKIYPIQQVSEKFKKREFVIETQEQYPQVVKMELIQDKCDDLNNYKLGDLVSVYFNIKGREYTPQGKDEPIYYNTIQVWKIVSLAQKQANATISKQQEAATIDSDNLPF